jgi:hypothetical protein
MHEEHGQEQGMSIADARTRWGRVKLGDGRLPALWTALPFGIVLAVALAGVVVMTGEAGPRPAVGAIAVAAVTIWQCTGLVWAMIVDRNTLQGATANPEQSIESAWYERAAAGAFSDILLITGLGTAAIAFTGIEVPTLVALPGVIIVAAGSLAIRYFAQQRRG